MTEPRLCPSCGRENAHDALFCAACETMLPLDSASLHASTDESQETSASVLRCPRCLTRNTEDQVYCWRCLHELHSSDLVEGGALAVAERPQVRIPVRREPVRVPAPVRRRARRGGPAEIGRAHV